MDDRMGNSRTFQCFRLTKDIFVKDGIGNEKADGHSRFGDCPSAFSMFSRFLMMVHSSALR